MLTDKMAQASRRMGMHADEYTFADTQRDRQTDYKHTKKTYTSMKEHIPQSFRIS